MKSAVLFLIFNRPDTTSKVFEKIRKAAPPRLYVAADGYRRDVDGEIEKCDKAKLIATSVDWDCEVFTLFREDNIGCKYGVSASIDWFFEYEEEGVILEDDIVPCDGFFDYCDKALDRYRDDDKVGMISGHSIVNKNGFASVDKSECKFVYYALVWGWATWKKVWNDYDVSISSWGNDEKSFLFERFKSDVYVGIWTNIYDKVFSGSVNAWSFQLYYLMHKSNLFALVPPYNLIDNIGYGIDATHTVEAKPYWAGNSSDIDVSDIIFPDPVHNYEIDKMFHRVVFGVDYYYKIKFIIKKIFSFFGLYKIY